MNVEYELVSPQDLKYGSKDENTGKWNGLVGMVVNRVSITFLDLGYCTRANEGRSFNLKIVFSAIRLPYKNSKRGSVVQKNLKLGSCVHTQYSVAPTDRAVI